MDSHCLTVFGLVLDIVGVVLLFFYAPPEPETYGGQGVEDNNIVGPRGETAGEMRRREAIRRARSRVLSIVGLVLLLIGFVLQLGAQFA